jgi:hypothetical protein
MLLHPQVFVLSNILPVENLQRSENYENGFYVRKVLAAAFLKKPTIKALPLL